MARRIKIAALFIGAIVIPSIFLSILALRALENERLVISKKIEGAYAGIADLLSREIREPVEKLENKIKETVLAAYLKNKDLSSIKPFLHSSQKENKLIKQFFLLDKKGKIVFPEVIPFAAFHEYPNFTSDITEKYKQAVKLEFVDNNYHQAIQLYKESLSHLYDKNMQAVLLQSIGRCYFKSGQLERAVEGYRQITRKYPESRNINGLSLSTSAHCRLAEIFIEQNKSMQAVEEMLLLYRGIIDNRLGLCKEEWSYFKNKTESLLLHLFESHKKSKWFEHFRNDFLLLKKEEKEKSEQRLFIIRLQRNFLSDLSAAERDKRDLKFKHISKVINGKSHLLAYFNFPSGLLDILGFELNLDYLRLRVLPEKLAGVSGKEDFIVAVSGETGKVIVGSSETFTRKSFASRSLEPLPWTITVSSRNPALLEKLSRRRVTFSTAMIILLASTVILGTYFAFRGLAKEVELSRQKSDFVSNVSHELRTPLTTIRMFSETVQRRRLPNPEKEQEYLDAIVKQTKHLTHLVDGILDFSRMEEGKEKYNFQPTNMESFINEITTTFRSSPARDKPDINLKINSPLPEIRIDRQAISQAIFNLLNNAVKYSPGREEIQVNVEKADAYILIEVVDQGIGIGLKEQKKIFEKFYRIDNKLTRQVKGSGLGLTIVNHIARAHGGKVTVESQKDRGSKFTLFLSV